MKKSTVEEPDELRPEYDLSTLKSRVRGKYAEEYGEGTNLVLIEPDIFDAFSSAEAVNKALRSVLKKRPPHSETAR